MVKALVYEIGGKLYQTTKLRVLIIPNVQIAKRLETQL